MNKKQAAEQIGTLFQSTFNRDNYTHFLRNLLNDFEVRNNHYSGNTVPDAFKQHINQYWRIGKYTDPETVEIDLYVIEVKSLSKLDRARTALRNFAVRTMQTFGDKDHALIAFYAKEDGGEDWRFSYVKIEHSAKLDKKSGKAKLEKELTPAKRYSFLVGEHETSHTAQAQLVDLLAMDYANPTVEEIEKAFSIEKVTKEFFEQYKALFIRLSEVLAEQPHFQQKDEEKQKQHIAKFSKKLLGQIVFLYFLQKKGWMGVGEDKDWGTGERRFLKKLFDDAKNADENYYVEKLQFLFYEALANDRKDQFDPSYYQRFDCKIPFLNGGLFEADYDWQKITVAIPNAIFSNNEKTKVGDIGTGILDVFNRYNFTIKEDEPLEKEVAVDPEMLGKVFENMLEITERKSKGAFYTPREIVHYMCQESLIHYLNGECRSSVPLEDIQFLVRKGIFAIENDQRILNKGKETEAYSFKLPEPLRNNAGLIDDKLADIKICDPAIGSGAFPLGMLHEIVHARQALAPHLPNEKQLPPYDLKKHTIANSIYGVDIDPSAIDIARLRLWLSLVVDEDDYSSIDALPNLDYKIMQGNSLIEEYEGVKLFDEAFIQDEGNSLEREKAELKQKQIAAQTNYFAAKNAGNKDLQDQYDNDLKELLKAIRKIESKAKKQAKEKDRQATGLFDLIGEARKKANQLEHLHQEFFDVSSPARKRELRDQITTIEWELIEATLAEQNKTDALAKLEEYKTSGEKPWFLWKLNFSEVFKQKGGFDIVIGNPPYISHDKIEQSDKEALKKNYKSYEPFADLYCYFLELPLLLSNSASILSFITSNSYFRANYGAVLRKILAEQFSISRLINIDESQIFDGATVNAAIAFYSRPKIIERAFVTSGAIPLGTTFENFVLKTEFRLDQDYFKRKIWNLTSGEVNAVLSKMESRGITLEKLGTKIRLGIATGENKAFVINSTKREELIEKDPNSTELIKPVLRGRDIQKYSFNEPDQFILLTQNGVDVENEYPAIYSYLNSLGDRFKERGAQGQHWTNLRACSFFDDFKKEQIIWIELTDKGRFALSTEEIYLLNSAYFLLSPSKVSSLYLLAILNSEVIEFYLKANGETSGMGTSRWINNHVKEFPVAIPDSSTQNRVSSISAYICQCVKDGNSLLSSFISELIDGLVYELYFPEEIKAAGKEILPHLGELAPLTDAMSEEEKLAVIQREFERLYDPSHLVRNHLETLDSVEEIRIIREALKR